MSYVHQPDAPQVNPFDPVGDGYGEIDDSDLLLDRECVRCRRPCNSDESPGDVCPDCWEAEHESHEDEADELDEPAL